MTDTTVFYWIYLPWQKETVKTDRTEFVKARRGVQNCEPAIAKHGTIFGSSTWFIHHIGPNAISYQLEKFHKNVTHAISTESRDGNDGRSLADHVTPFL